MNREEQRMKFWCDMVAAYTREDTTLIASGLPKESDNPFESADSALDEFDKRFPKEEGLPIVDPEKVINIAPITEVR